MADEDSVVFSKLTYLGCASVNAPRSEVEALRMMSILRSQGQISVDVTLSVPNVSEGTVRYLPFFLEMSDRGGGHLALVATSVGKQLLGKPLWVLCGISESL